MQTKKTRVLIDAIDSKEIKTELKPLHFAAKLGLNRLVKLLIAAKADVNSKDIKSGRTPL